MNLLHFLFLFTLLLYLSKAKNLFVGGGGGAYYFDHEREDLIGFQWLEFPIYEYTVEMWYRRRDPLMEEMSLISYSAYNVSHDPIYEEPNEVLLWFRQDTVRVWKAGAIHECIQPECDFITEDWFHVAISWSMNGTIQIFRDGKRIYDSIDTSEKMTTPIVGRGCFHFSQEADAFCNQFDELQALDGVVDEMRFWSKLRTEDEIRENYRKVIQNPESEPNLALYWRFDKSEHVEQDLSGNGNDGVLATLPDPKNAMVYQTKRSTRPPSSPRFVSSTAPFYGSGLTFEVLVESELSQQQKPTVEVTLKALYSGTVATNELVTKIMTFPTQGTLRQIDDSSKISTSSSVVVDKKATSESLRVIYELSSSVFSELRQQEDLEAVFLLDTFEYSVSDGNETDKATVQLFYKKRTPDPKDKKYTTDEDTQITIVLGGFNEETEYVQVEVLTAPTRGQLYELAFVEGKVPSYISVMQDATQLTPINDFPVILTPLKGHVLYIPALNQGSKTELFDSFTFRWVDSSKVPSRSAKCDIYVIPVNDPPDNKDGLFFETNLEEPTIHIELVSEDVDPIDWSETNYRISQWPMIGFLNQSESVTDSETGLTNTTIGPVITDLPLITIVSWAQKLRYFTSQYSLCAGCYYWQVCDSSCAQTGWHAEQILGEPDVYPIYGDYKEAWSPVAADGGIEYIDLEFAAPVYASKVTVVETFVNGALIKIEGTSNYIDNVTTQWDLLWRGLPVTGLPELARLYSPPVCIPPHPVQVIRLTFDTLAIPGWSEFDAVQMEGTADPPKGKVTSNSVYYSRIRGLYANFDKFAYRASDCLNESDDIWTYITFPELDINNFECASPEAFSVNRIGLIEGSNEMEVDLSAVENDFKERFSSEIKIDNSYETSSYLVCRPDSLSTITQESIEILAASPVNMTDIFHVKVEVGSPRIEYMFVIEYRWPQIPVSEEKRQSSQVPNELKVSYTLKVIGDIICSGTDIRLSTTGECVPCGDIPKEQKNAMSENERVYYDSTCIKDYKSSTPLRTTFLVLAIVGLVLCLVLFIFLFINKDHKLIRGTSFLFSSSTLVGAALGYSIIFTIYESEPDDPTCMSRIWVVVLWFSIMFGSMFVKTHRLYALYSAVEHMKKVQVSDIDLLKRLSIIVSLFCSAALFWSLIDPHSSTVEIRDNERYITCTNEHSAWFIVIGIGAILLIVWGTFLTFKTRSAPYYLNEAWYYAMSIYNFAVLALIIAPLVAIFSDEPDIMFLLISIGVLVGVTGVILLINGPKIGHIYLGIGSLDGGTSPNHGSSVKHSTSIS